jgi:hypothetical protein
MLADFAVLEEVTMATISWIDGYGNWNTAADWSTGTVPGPGDSVVITQSGPEITTNAGSVASLTTSTFFDIAYGSSPASAGSLTVTGNFTETGGSAFVAGSINEEATLTVDGTLANSGGFSVGSNSANALASVYANAFTNTGTIYLVGGPGVPVLLDIGSAAGFGTAGVVTGGVNLTGNSQIEFASGQITSIGTGGSLTLNDADGGGAYIEDSGSTGSNSALVGLSSSAGGFLLENGYSFSTSGDFITSGNLDVDNDSYAGGSNLTINGTLNNSGSVAIGNGLGDMPTTVTANALIDNNNLGTISLDGSSSTLVQLDVNVAAGFGTAGVLSGKVSLTGDSLIEFASGEITSIIGSLTLNGNEAFVADAGSTGSNSALNGLSSISEGILTLQSGASITTNGNLTNSQGSALYVDFGQAGGGSSLTVDGTLINNGSANLGEGSGAAGTTVDVNGLTNTGSITLGSNANTQALLDAGAAAGFGTAGILTGQVYLYNNALLEFASGQITSIAQAASLELYGSKTFIADAGSTSSNSALTGLTNNSGSLTLQDGASVSLSEGLTSSGGINVDNGSSGASSLTVNGTLANSGTVIVGNSGETSSATVSANGLTNSGTINITGKTGAQASFTIDGAASNSASVTINAAASLTVTGGASYTQSSGGTGVFGTLGAAAVNVTGGALEGIGGSVDGSVGNTGGDVVAGINPGSSPTPGLLTIDGNYAQSGTGVFTEVIGGTGSGQAGALDVSGGTVTLSGGALQVDFANGFKPTLGETFTVMNFTPGDLNGQFASIAYNNGSSTVTGNSSRVNIGGGLAMEVVYGAGNIELDTVTDVGPSDNFTGNASSDILGWNPSTGVIGDFVMTGGVAGAFQDIAWVNPSSGYQVVGSGDFYGSGTADILLANSSGFIGQFEMSSNTATWQGIGLINSGTGWAVAGTGDFYGNGTDDILLANQSAGQIGEFEMNNGVATWQGIGTVNAAAGWAVAGTGDFFGTGTGDILLANQSAGQIGMFEMNKGVASWQGIGTVDASSGWAVAGTGDFFGNGTDDILLANTQTGALGMFAMHNGVASWQSIGTVGAGWQVAGAGDYFGNGTSDILLQNASTGGIGMFAMNNGVASWQGIASLPTGWHVS